MIALLLTAAVLMVIGAYGVPRLLNAHITSGEDAAIAALINISEAQAAYRKQYPQIGYAAELARLSATRDKHCVPSPQQFCVLEYDLARNNGRPFRGYYFTEMVSEQSPLETYTVVAVPAHYARTGVRAFCVIERGVPRYRDLGHDASPGEITRDECLRDFKPLP